MREQLIQYVNLLFAGAPNSEEIRQEILQNTLDRYDDLIAQGKSPEAAYRLAISGIGDINEILGNDTIASSDYTPSPQAFHDSEKHDTPEKKKMRAAAIVFYILCILPLLILGDLGYESLGFSLTLIMVAAATYLMILGSKTEPEEENTVSKQKTSPRQELKRSIGAFIWAIGLALYIVLSFLTNAWYITWILFPIIGCVHGLVKACMDLKEANQYEN